jgi:RNA polymerase sigma factor (TIGR02999 family)
MSAPITDLLAAARGGDADAGEAVARAVYHELRTLAASYLRRERADHSLQPTALVHEAYVRLMGQTAVDWQSRAHFFGIAAQVMRRLLVDHARRTRAQRRDGGRAITLDEAIAGDTASGTAYDVLGVHEALEQLAVIDARQARLVELRYFVGLTIDETAAVLEISAATGSREWALARAWLQRALETQEHDAPEASGRSPGAA